MAALAPRPLPPQLLLAELVLALDSQPHPRVTFLRLRSKMTASSSTLFLTILPSISAQAPPRPSSAPRGGTRMPRSIGGVRSHPLALTLALLLALGAPRLAAAQCSGSTYSYGSGACASCAAGASFISSSAGCAPSATLTSGPADTALYLSGSQAEGVTAFAATGAAPSYAAGVFGSANGALVLARGSYLSVAGAGVPSALPSGGSVAWSASAWVKCAAPVTWAAVLEWGAVGDAQQGASPQAAALVVGATVPLPNSGVVTTLAGSGTCGFVDGARAASRFSALTAIAVVPSSGVIVVADTGNHCIRLVTPLGNVTTLAGSGSAAFANGTGTAARFSSPSGVAVIPSSGVIVVADQWNHRIRLVTPLGVVTSLAGSGSAAFADGAGTAASFIRPQGVAVIPSSGMIVVADTGNHRIRLVTPLGVVTSLAGSGSSIFSPGTGTGASFWSPKRVAVVPSSGVIVVAEFSGIRLVTPLGVVTSLGGSLSGGVAVIPATNVIVVAATGSHRVRLITNPGGADTTLAGSGGGDGGDDDGGDDDGGDGRFADGTGGRWLRFSGGHRRESLERHDCRCRWKELPHPARHAPARTPGVRLHVAPRGADLLAVGHALPALGLP
jgi:serine/threonine-protein kinase